MPAETPTAEPTPEPSEVVRQACYAMWRFDVWLKGYGSYRSIEAKVAAGQLIVGRDYPRLKTEFDAEGSLDDQA